MALLASLFFVPGTTFAVATGEAGTSGRETAAGAAPSTGGFTFAVPGNRLRLCLPLLFLLRRCCVVELNLSSVICRQTAGTTASFSSLVAHPGAYRPYLPPYPSTDRSPCCSRDAWVNHPAPALTGFTTRFTGLVCRIFLIRLLRGAGGCKANSTASSMFLPFLRSRTNTDMARTMLPGSWPCCAMSGIACT